MRAPALLLAAAVTAAAIHGALGAPLTPAAIQPPMKDARAYLDSYSFWVLGDDGSAMMATVLLSNLAGTPTRPGFSVMWYGADGEILVSEAELGGETLKVGGPPLDLSFGANRLVAEGAGYRLHLEGPVSGGGQLEADLRLSPGAPGHTWQPEGLKVDDGVFWLGQLFPTGLATGSLKLTGAGEARILPIAGQVYGDHSWQDVWAHRIARRWVNLRFFSAGPDLALTTWTSPEGVDFARGTLAEGGQLVATVESARVELAGGPVDEASGYRLPASLTVDAGAGGKLTLELEPPMDRRDLLSGVTPVLKHLVQWFVARPYSYRFRQEGTLILPGEAGPRAVGGTLVAEVIYVNTP